MLRVVFILLLVFPVFGRDAREQTRIDYLIRSLGALKGAVFIRNEVEYDSAAAQNHLQQKLRYAGERIQTAEQFVRYCATQSSMSHRPYQIRFANGSVINTADYFNAKLKEFEAEKKETHTTIVNPAPATSTKTKKTEINLNASPSP